MLEYDGTMFNGWQQQVRPRTVEEELKLALKRLSGLDHKVYGAGRTDAGAHALGQVVSFQWLGVLALDRLQNSLNGVLPEDISVVSVEQVDDAFHARYSARWRRYRYRYLDRPGRPALERNRCWWVHRPLDAEAMDLAAQALVGRHDWSSLSSPGDRDPVRTMREARICRAEGFVELELVAEGFLPGMARTIAALLAEVGLGRSPEVVAEVLAGGIRRQDLKPAPARGLTLIEVIYE